MINAEVRVVTVDGEPWFVAKDVTDILGFKNGPQAVQQHVLPAQTQTYRINGFGRESFIISEAGLYRLILRSTVPGAAKFQAWVTDEVLPTRT